MNSAAYLKGMCTCGLLCALLWPNLGAAAPDADAERIYLRKDCEESFDGGTTLLENDACVESMSDVNDWLANTRTVPSSGNPWKPVLIDVGAGEWGGFSCACRGSCTDPATQDSITLHGSGREVTTIHPSSGNGVTLDHCSEVAIEHMTILSGSGGNDTAIGWSGPGTSTYIDVRAEGTAASWREVDITYYTSTFVCPQAAFSEHWVYDSVFVGQGQYSWISTCSRSWIYGSEVTGGRWALQIGYEGDVRVFGGVVRALPTSEDSWADVAAVNVGAGTGSGRGIFHMHGGNIVADARAIEDADAIGVDSHGSNVYVHTPGSSFLVSAAGEGKAYRLRGAGTVLSPSLLPASDDPPDNGSGTDDYVSLHGQDLFVETDCSDEGDCDSTGEEAHLMIYDDSCSSESWRDAVTGRCRNDTGN